MDGDGARERAARWDTRDDGRVVAPPGDVGTGPLSDHGPTSAGARSRPRGPMDTHSGRGRCSSARLVLICGLPASGKTTLARQLAPGIPAIRLDKDQWTTELGLDVWDDEFRVRLERRVWALTRELLARGQSVILEWGHWARVERDEKRLAARALGVEVELHYLRAPLEELIERAQRRTASGEWRAAPMTRAHFERWEAIFQPPDAEELQLFDRA